MNTACYPICSSWLISYRDLVQNENRHGRYFCCGIE
jgi:hypothetical protein